MSDTTELIKTYAPLVTPFIPTIVETFVKPKLQRLSKFLKKNDTQSLISVEAKFTEYLERSYEKHLFIPILIFQNQQRKLEEIYIPMTVRRERGKETFLIDTYPKGFLPKYKKVLIRDTAGMGKSTLMKRLFLSCLEEGKGIPVFIELRKLKGDDSIINFIHRELNPINDEFDTEFILNLIKDGNFIFFFDGYDEISQSERERVTLNLHDFISKTGNNLFIMTSRPETSLASFPDFMEFDIKPLELEEAFALLRRYDKDDELSAEIISKLEGDILENIGGFLENPLLVSLLYKSYEYKHTIPLKKHIFYRQVYDALFENHDLTKEGWTTRDKHCQLDSDSFHTILRALGFITMKHGIEYSKDNILFYLKQAKQQCSTIEFKDNKFLDDLLQTVPLFTKDGNYYRWSHKSFQDYFTAQFIWKDAGEQKSMILRKMVRSKEREKYLNVLDLFYNIDYKAFRQNIIYDFLADFLTCYDSPIPHLKNNIKKKALHDFKLQTFGRMLILIPRRLFTIDSIVENNHFDNEKMLFHIRKLLNEKAFLLDDYRHNTYSYPGFYWFENYNQMLFDFLKLKEENKHLFTSFNLGEVKTKYTSHENLINELLIIWNGDIDSLKNSEFNFEEICSFTNIYNSVLDFNKCKQLKEEIEVEIEREKANDLYDNL